MKRMFKKKNLFTCLRVVDFEMLVPFVECVVIERDTCLFLSQCLLSFFSSLIYLFTFFLV